jgi:phosphonate transport system substrate-binding protein
MQDRLRAVLTAALCALLMVAPFAQVRAASTDAAGPLTLGFMPYLNAEHLIEKYTPLARYLSEALDRPVHITVARDYAEHIRLTGEDALDISFLGGSPYVVIGEQYGQKPLLVRFEFDGMPTFRSVIVVERDSPYQELSDLAGARVAFGSTNSTLSTQVPVYMLIQAGVRLEDLADRSHLRNHENVILGVQFGDFDAGAVAEEVFVENRDKPIRALAYSRPLSTHVFVTRATMDPALRGEIAEALLTLRDHTDSTEILGAISTTLTGFAPVTDSDYDPHRDILAVVLPVLKDQ